ncbi:ABC transporter ATP-binding protein [Shimia ponticola]|uniref:ABC transporter ATP-binding protein n=1 Tax=Shimia ponticola TaxID=2582893 RepID=UPI0011BE6A96|nr:ABC transporter ATP-binding protein [Shimia ponticola]
MGLFRTSKNGPLFTPRDKDNLGWFWTNYFKKRSPWLIVVFVFVGIQALVYQQFLALTENGLRVIFDSGDVQALFRVCAIVFGLFLIRAIVSYLTARLSAILASGAVKELRIDMINHMMTLDLAYFERTRSGQVMNRLVRQTGTLSSLVGQSTVNALRDIVTIVVVAIYLIYKSAILFAAAIIVVPAIVLLVNAISARVKKAQRQTEAANAEFMNGIEEMLGGMRTVKISNQEPMEAERIGGTARKLRKLAIRLNSIHALVLPSLDMTSAVVYTLVIGGGGYLALSGTAGFDGASIITFLLGMVLIFDPARHFAKFVAQLQGQMVVLDQVRDVFREQPLIADKPDARADIDHSGDIVLENVSFGYSEGQPLFNGLNMTLEGGKTTAIVGGTGSGKTTVLSLLARLYEVQGGRVSIGGTDIRDIKLETLRRAFSMVAQDIVIFNNTIWENIKYVRPEATDDEVWAAAEAATIADLIRQRGDAELGPKGNQLSGGQKQRIAIARAFLRTAPILLLDEATSALDQKTEERIQSSLNTLSSDKTVVIIAHRLSSITHADKIYLMDAGRIVEQGTHAELMALNGLYAQMYSSQKENYV